MAVNLYNIKKWFKMLNGTSVLHVNQNMGTLFIPGEIRGYFNNLTEKVIKEPILLENDQLPRFKTENGQEIIFPVAVFQYGLGAYDLYLKTKNQKYLFKFKQCVDWTIENQENSGAWSNFFYIYPDNPYGAMCQGEAISLLVRAFKEYKDEKYYNAAMVAAEFMITPVEKGGTLKVENGNYILLEYTNKAAVLNGWIFALFGLYDLLLIDKTKAYEEIYKKSIDTLVNMINLFDGGYWSLYDLDNTITSPFYHNLHIAQMHALYIATGNEVFAYYEKRWSGQKNNAFKRKRAFIKKAFQKIIEK